MPSPTRYARGQRYSSTRGCYEPSVTTIPVWMNGRHDAEASERPTVQRQMPPLAGRSLKPVTFPWRPMSTSREQEQRVCTVEFHSLRHQHNEWHPRAPYCGTLRCLISACGHPVNRSRNCDCMPPMHSPCESHEVRRARVVHFCLGQGLFLSLLLLHGEWRQ